MLAKCSLFEMSLEQTRVQLCNLRDKYVLPFTTCIAARRVRTVGELRDKVN
jgi:hypothetical protein